MTTLPHQRNTPRGKNEMQSPHFVFVSEHPLESHGKGICMAANQSILDQSLMQPSDNERYSLCFKHIRCINFQKLTFYGLIEFIEEIINNHNTKSVSLS